MYLPRIFTTPPLSALILPTDTTYFRYIDDTPLLPQLIDRLNRIEHRIDFTYKIETKYTLPYLDEYRGYTSKGLPKIKK